MQVPTAVAVFPTEIYKMPKNWGTSLYNLQQWTVYSKGGHFAAKEEPKLWHRTCRNSLGTKLSLVRSFTRPKTSMVSVTQ